MIAILEMNREAWLMKMGTRPLVVRKVLGETEIGALFEHMRQNERFQSTQIPRTEAKLAEATKRMLKNEEAWSPRTHVKVGSIILKLMLESLTVSMRLDDERFDEYIYFEKYLLEKPSWTKKYKKGFRSEERILRMMKRKYRLKLCRTIQMNIFF